MRVMGVFSVYAPFSADLSLLFQVVAFIVLMVAVVFKRKARYGVHASLILVAVLLHVVSVFVVMVPSLLGYGGVFEALSIVSAVFAGHAVLGFLVLLLSVWLLGSWLTHTRDFKPCFKRKNVMRVTVVFWVLELLLGVYVYVLLYVPV